ncbi:hypothetical protein CHISP_0275 [Chitinispirillum alkaliphilum]|nr:hypothetical protein CHISP_0275 [Chitinispirillum alkaliphilum]
MSECELELIRMAQGRHQKIYPCSDKKDLNECFTRHGNTILLWYNTEDMSTHVIRKKLGEVAES